MNDPSDLRVDKEVLLKNRPFILKDEADPGDYVGSMDNNRITVHIAIPIHVRRYVCMTESEICGATKRHQIGSSTAPKVIDSNNIVASSNERVADVGADHTGTSSYEDLPIH